VGNVFLSPSAYLENRHLFDEHRDVFFVVGLHPHESHSFSPSMLDEIKEIVAEDVRVKAVGEIGLDFFRNLSSRQEQIRAFEAQLELARDMDVPVVIHCRDALSETLRILEDMGFKGRRLMWHCFTLGRDEAGEILARGWMVSIPGVVTFKKAEALRDAVKEIPLSRMLIETDCPFLTPSPFRGKRNEPAYVAYTAQAISSIKGIGLTEVWRETGKNAKDFFSLK